MQFIIYEEPNNNKTNMIVNRIPKEEKYDQ
jgi:hypothetical protein